MRKIKRVLAVISAVATLAVSAVPVSAETTDENIKAENIDIAFGSDYFDTTDAEHNSYAEIKYGLAEYINENHIYGQIITGFTNENNEDYIYERSGSDHSQKYKDEKSHEQLISFGSFIEFYNYYYFKYEDNPHVSRGLLYPIKCLRNEKSCTS